jgi:glycosyltransferase involved in cell wall biosynthesis
LVVIVMRVKPRIFGTNLQMEPGLVSVMMPAYNAKRYISQAIESVLTQSYSRWELIVVNDGSTDATARIAASFGDPRIHLIEQANGGEASARNTALRHMRGEFVAFLDADDEYLPHHLEATAGFLLNNPLYDAVYSDGYFCDEARRLLRTLASRRLKPSSGRIYDQVVRASCMLGPPVCVVLRRNIIEQYDLAFDTAITIGPDWDFLTRCADVGQFAYIDRQTCLYRLHQANISSSVRSARRAADLAKCRQKAIRSPSFKHCSVGTRVAVFDDLLLNLLLGKAREQAQVTQWTEFADLPVSDQARLLRLMASRALVFDADGPHVAEWLRQSRTLQPSQSYATCLSILYALSPALCKLLLRIRTFRQQDPRTVVPFADLKLTPQIP